MKTILFLHVFMVCNGVVKSQVQCVHGERQDKKDKKDEEKCKCDVGWKGTLCDKDLDECLLDNQKCVKNHTEKCENTEGSFKCYCKLGYEGEFCQVDIDDCYPNHCSKHGRCVDHVGWYSCVCEDGYMGQNCTQKKDAQTKDCQERGCPEHSKCIHPGGQCKCDSGWTGSGIMATSSNCTNLDECTVYHGVCNQGTCQDTLGSFRCTCYPGYEGTLCTNKTDYCKSRPCVHGQCLSEDTDFRCQCMEDYEGKRCDELIDPCRAVNCTNGVCERKSSTEYMCACNPGFGGQHCEISCLPNPCKNNGNCSVTSSDEHFKCACPHGWSGDDCSNRTCVDGFCQNGGQCRATAKGLICQCEDGFEGQHCENRVKKQCPNPSCKKHFAGRQCQQECNIPECDWDGTDCSLGVDPWLNCTVPRCWKVFGNGVCDKECNSDVCLFDDRDCDVAKKCPDEKYCEKVFGNGKCDVKCNTKECAFDNNECKADKPKMVLPGELILTLITSKAEFDKNRNAFIRSASLLLNCHVIVVNVEEVSFQDDQNAVRKRRAVNKIGLKVRMQLDTKNCENHCFRYTKSAASFIGAKKSKGQLKLPFRVYSVASTRKREPTISPLWIATCVAIPILLLGVIALTRKVVARLWHPERDNRFAANDMRREPVGQEVDEMTNLQRRESLSGTSPSDEGGNPKRIKVEMVGSLGSNDWLNVKGVLREQSDVSNSTVHFPVNEISPKDIRADTSGETNLHVAARLSKTELARQLIEFGVDINARDKNGKTPLHLAVSSGADGVFQLLISNRACQIDLQDYEIRTALMNACHYCHNNMVDELISNGAKVNLTDSQGRTALHGAAMVDNHKAVLALLKNGAKVDAQDNKGQTPLFLAARDGAYTTAYVLLANYANRNCADSMDITPLTISHQRGQKDLVALLSDWTGSPHGMMTSPQNSPPALSSPSSGTISPTPACSQYSDIRPKLPAGYRQINAHCNTSKPPMKRKRKSKSQKEKAPPVETGHPSFLNSYTTNLAEIYPTPRSSVDKQEMSLPEPVLNSADIMEGINAIYPPLEQINNIPSRWGTTLGGDGHFQYNNSMFTSNRQFPFQQHSFINPHDNINQGHTFPTPPSVGVESSNDLGSPSEHAHVLPSPFLTPSPDTWSNSPGNSDNSAC